MNDLGKIRVVVQAELQAAYPRLCLWVLTVSHEPPGRTAQVSRPAASSISGLLTSELEFLAGFGMVRTRSGRGYRKGLISSPDHSPERSLSCCSLVHEFLEATTLGLANMSHDQNSLSGAYIGGCIKVLVREVY